MTLYSASRIRYCENKCKGTATELVKKTLVTYLTSHYVNILRDAGHQRIYHEDRRIVLIEGDDHYLGKEGSFGTHQLSVTRWDHSQLLQCHGFDQVLAITQGSLNMRLSRMWHKASMKKLRNLDSHSKFQSLKRPKR